jgi:hypothetical protein
MTTDATRPFHSDASAAEKIEALRNDEAQAAEGLATGYDAMRLQGERGCLPVYPRQTNHPFAIDAPTEPPLGYAIDQVADVTKVQQR